MPKYNDYDHTLKVLNNELNLVFYDVTTLYFEAERKMICAKQDLVRMANIDSHKLCWDYRIEAHICIAFCRYKIYKELDRQLLIKNAGLSPEKAVDIAKTIYRISIQTSLSNTIHSRLFPDKDEQRNSLKLFDL